MPTNTAFSRHLAEQIASLHQARDHSPYAHEPWSLLAVTKTIAHEQVRQAYNAGLRHFGENYVQALIDRRRDLADLTDAQWYFIGSIQSNKIKHLAQYADYVLSLASLHHARKLSEARLAIGLPPIAVCIQVNISNDPHKDGIALHSVPDFVDALYGLTGLQCVGLMTITATALEPAVMQQQYALLRQQFESLAANHPHWFILSMGMTQDAVMALTCGSTLLRLGTALFGHRDRKPSEY
jgi:pyridoxal phosphate enzyme (YggS family)